MTEVELERQREENRRRDPLMATLVDQVREYFPGAVVVKIRGGHDRAMTPFEKRALLKKK